MSDYTLRQCPFCAGWISNLSKRGNILSTRDYAKRTSCHNCRDVARQTIKPFVYPVLDQPIDNFIYGRLQHD